MDAVAIGRMHTRYRLPARAGGLDRRLAEAHHELLGGTLETAIETARERVGVGPDEAVCVRRLAVRVHLGGHRGASDQDAATAGAGADLGSAWAADWADAVAIAFRDALARGGGEVVRYPSRGAAWIDCAAGVSAGDLGRAWAWRRLGLWRGGAGDSPSAAAAQLAQGLALEGEVVVPVLAALARRGLLVPLASHLDPPAWTLLAAAALQAHEVDPDLLEDALEPSSGVPAPGGPGEAAAGLVAASGADRDEAPGAGSPLSDLARVVTRPSARPIAVLTLLADDPSAGRWGGGVARTRVAALVRRLAGGRVEAAGPPDPDERPVEPPIEPGAEAPVVATEPAPVRPVESASSHPQPSPGYPQAVPTAAGRRESIADAPVGEEGATGESSDPVPPPRESGCTDWGGLVLLLNVLEPAGVLAPGGLSSPGRTLRWGLHRLAQALAPVAADDSAALAFAGLGPAAHPPSLGAPPASVEEDELMAALRGQVAARLHRALDAGAESADAVLERICRRPAEIVADPGWIEVRFPLAVVSTEVRRAGLDLDPGWLPWLGAVIKLRYEDRLREDWP